MSPGPVPMRLPVRASSRGDGFARLALAAAVLALAGCAGLAPPSSPAVPLAVAPAEAAAEPRRVTQTLQLAGVPVQAEWHLPPDGQASVGAPGGPAIDGLVTLQHGFSRQCSHLRGTARALAAAGASTLCLEASMAGGNAALAGAFAARLAEPGFAPPGRPRPARVVVAGFSAGAHFAVVLGARLAELEPGRVAGAVLLDPVAGRGFEDALQRLGAQGRRPVLSIAAQASGCNARHNAHPALRRLREGSQPEGAAGAEGPEGFAGVVFGAGSTHMDAEGEDTDVLAWLACGRQWPDAQIVRQLRELARCWTGQLLAAPAAAGATVPAAAAPAPAASLAALRACAQPLLAGGAAQELR